ncbi:MAG: GTPase HflX, partial [Oscillospiraceae bacterium]|nr:GTPase HflX [Oscillospiraceae bacterium]
MEITYTKAILAGYDSGDDDYCEQSLDELEELAKTAGAETVAKIMQKRASPDTATVLGEGKIEEIKDACDALDAELIIFDCELSGSQIRNIEKVTEVRVIDRTMLILDIFAGRAQTNEARLAVELAQLEYSLPRLKRMWTHLERQGVGGVGLRGPGEKQLEVDRRLAQKRILDLKAELRTIHERRQREVSARKKSRTVSLVGYTNAG